MKRIVFLRHPQTAFNVEPIRLRGGMDVPLSPAGFAQIEDIVLALKAAFPDIRQIYSSPLERASILATSVAHEYGLKVGKLSGLKSWDYGVLNGRPVTEVTDVLKRDPLHVVHPEVGRARGVEIRHGPRRTIEPAPCLHAAVLGRHGEAVSRLNLAASVAR